ncbi:DUF2612 domain-containing protein [Entomohabitans teleogrylli]|uniref:DUF2612 domain-containing protein n=1 Tax=Entomohabitans teleogrylli TaxID=1384589 RepID=UPI00073D5AA3|nr:DUF2612 domain-containing protein [Entomohabitans teleogrylli]
MAETIPEINNSVNLLRNIIWQTDGSNIQTLIEKKQDWYNQAHEHFWNNWFRDVFDIRTANDFGLNIWARILGISFTIQDCPNLSLTTKQKRLVCRLRYYQLITRSTIPEINGILKDLFGEENGAYALDPNDMSYIMYVFEEQPSDDLSVILAKYDLLPRPATVGIKFRVLEYEPFGFGPYNMNFNNAPFWWGDGLHYDFKCLE